MSSLDNIIASASATCVAELATLPFCTLKTNYQNTTNSSISEISRRIWNQHGARGFYNASTWAISSQVLSTTSKYTIYQEIKEYAPNKFAAGAITGVMASCITHPFDVLKIHAQMHKPFIPELRAVGPLLFYRGYSKTASKSLIGSSCFFPIYDTAYHHTNNPVYSALISAVASTIIMQPVDYMKTRHIFGQSYFSGWNPRPYFKGLSLNMARIVPHFVITMTLIEKIKKHLDLQ